MSFPETLQPRNEGCTASLIDKGNNRPLVPACMGALGIEGADVNVVGCNNIDVCKTSLNQRREGWVEFPVTNESGVVTHTNSVRIGRPLREAQ